VYNRKVNGIQIYDPLKRQVTATVETSPIAVTCLTYKVNSKGVTLVVDDKAGDITVWNLIDFKDETAAATTKSGERKEGVGEGDEEDKGGCRKYRIELVSTTANYKLNLLGVNIEGVKVSAMNAVLLKQFRAKGTPALYIQEDVDQGLSGGSSSHAS